MRTGVVRVDHRGALKALGDLPRTTVKLMAGTKPTQQAVPHPLLILVP
jgi:hypothetical protein